MAWYTASALQRAVAGVGRVLTRFVISPPGGRTCIVVLALVASSKIDIQDEAMTLFASPIGRFPFGSWHCWNWDVHLEPSKAKCIGA